MIASETCITIPSFPKNKSFHKATVLHHYMLSSEYDEGCFLVRYGKHGDGPNDSSFNLKERFDLDDLLPEIAEKENNGKWQPHTIYGKRGTFVVEVWFREDTFLSCLTHSEFGAPPYAYSFHDCYDYTTPGSSTCLFTYNSTCNTYSYLNE